VDKLDDNSVFVYSILLKKSQAQSFKLLWSNMVQSLIRNKVTK